MPSFTRVPRPTLNRGTRALRHIAREGQLGYVVLLIHGYGDVQGRRHLPRTLRAVLAPDVEERVAAPGA